MIFAVCYHFDWKFSVCKLRNVSGTMLLELSDLYLMVAMCHLPFTDKHWRVLLGKLQKETLNMHPATASARLVIENTQEKMTN